jgi:hypothetical protein
VIVVLATDLLEALGGAKRLASGETGVHAPQSPLLQAVNDLSSVSPGLQEDGSRRFLTNLREGRMLTVPAYRADEIIVALGAGDEHPVFALRALMHLPTTYDDAQEMASVALGGKENAEPGSIKTLTDALFGFARGLLADAEVEWEKTEGGQFCKVRTERDRARNAKRRAGSRVAA